MPRIEVHQLQPDRPDLLEAFAVVRAETSGEINPDDPPPPSAELRGELFVATEVGRRAGWVAFLDGEPAGELVVHLDATDANGHLLDGESLAVRPRLRRQGVADALLRAVLPDQLAEGRTSLLLWVPTLPSPDGEAYARRLGLTLRTQDRYSRVRVADLDHGLVDRWLAEGRDRTDGYRLVQYVGPAPDEHLEVVAAAHQAMEDMPLDELEWTIPSMTPDMVRTRDAARVDAGWHGVSTVAVAPDGSAAGLSDLLVNTHRPSLALQGDTGVRAEHRGRGLGRWLKAANLRRALHEEPRLEVVETANAESNPWMLDINEAMGFRPHIGYRAYQGDLAGALAAR